MFDLRYYRTYIFYINRSTIANTDYRTYIFSNNRCAIAEKSD